MFYRERKDNNYTIMSNYHLRDRNLSFRGKGLLCVMLSLPDDWKFNKQYFYGISSDSRTSTDKAFRELESLGYIKITKYRNELGRFDYIYDIYEKPYFQNGNTVF